MMANQLVHLDRDRGAIEHHMELRPKQDVIPPCGLIRLRFIIELNEHIQALIGK